MLSAVIPTGNRLNGFPPHPTTSHRAEATVLMKELRQRKHLQPHPTPVRLRSRKKRNNGKASDTPTMRLQTTYTHRAFMPRRRPSEKTNSHRTSDETMTSRPKNAETWF